MNPELALVRAQLGLDHIAHPAHEHIQGAADSARDRDWIVTGDGLHRGEGALQASDPLAIEEQNAQLETRLVLRCEHLLEGQKLHLEQGRPTGRRAPQSAHPEELAREQRVVEAGMARLAEANGGPGSEAGRRLRERKEAMVEEIGDLRQEINRLRGEARADQREASDRLDDAARTIEDDKLWERVRYSQVLIGTQDREYTREFEAETTRILEELQEELQRASDAAG